MRLQLPEHGVLWLGTCVFQPCSVHGWFDLFVSILGFSKQMKTLLSLLTVPPESCSSRYPADSPQLSLGVRSISITVTWNDFTWCAERCLSGAVEVGSSTNTIHGGLRVLRALCWEFVNEAVTWFIPGGLLLKWRTCFGECAWMHIRLRTVLAFAVLLVVHVILSVCVVTAVVPDTLPYCSCVQGQRKIKYTAWLLVSSQFINMQDFMYLYKREEPQKSSLASEQRF